jgi:hypothetical protein
MRPVRKHEAEQHLTPCAQLTYNHCDNLGFKTA